MRRSSGGAAGLLDRAEDATFAAAPVPLRTEFTFTLPRGYVDASGTVHRDGVMRLATARDELIPLRDDRVRENAAFLTVVLLARVVTRIGNIGRKGPGIGDRPIDHHSNRSASAQRTNDVSELADKLVRPITLAENEIFCFSVNVTGTEPGDRRTALNVLLMQSRFNQYRLLWRRARNDHHRAYPKASHRGGAPNG